MTTGKSSAAIKEAAQATADPEAALAGLAKLTAAHPPLANAADAVEPLAHLCVGSDALLSWLDRRPEDIAWIIGDEGALFSDRNLEEMERHLDQLMATWPADPKKALRVFKSRELIRISARELSGLAPMDETLIEWSLVAEVAIDRAVTWAATGAEEKYGKAFYTPQEGGEERPARFAVLAMGKLGGGELNISSDVDLIYVHSSDNGRCESEKVSLHEYFVGIGREVTRLLNDLTEDGLAFRVDCDLRPEGKAGELTNSIGAMEIYYESWGRAWERQALIKARHAGGDPETSGEILTRLYPFVYRKYMDTGAVDEIGDMKGKIDQNLKSKKGARKAERDLKLGRGGIREIEFVIQSIQLLYGGRYPELRQRSTLGALSAAASLGLVSRPHHRDLTESYIFYRQLENRVQYRHLLQTHDLPDPGYPLDLLARQMKIGLDQESPGETLLEEIKTKRDRVRAIFDLYFSQEEKEPDALFPAPLDDEEAIAEWLDSLYFDQPQKSARLLLTLRDGKRVIEVTSKSQKLFEEFGPALVAAAAETTWPDRVVIGFEQFVAARGARDTLFDMINRHRSLLTLLAALFASSESLTQTLIRQPDLFDRFIGYDPVGASPLRSEFKKEFQAAVDSSGDLPARLGRLNMVRSAKSVRLGLRRVMNMANQIETMTGLSDLAEEYVEALCPLALEESGFLGDETSWVALAGGKLGRREMNYGSDIDMMVFCRGADQAGVIRLTQSLGRLAKTITPYGAGYEIDMRLRPDGEKGQLVPTLASAASYYEKRGEAWERLALVGVRPIAGDPEFAKEAMEVVDTFIFGSPLTSGEIEKIATIRERIVKEKVKPGSLDIKFGEGGVVEIEFICQILRMEKGAKPPDDAPFTHATLHEARDKGWIGRAEAGTLINAYTVFRSIEDALRMDKSQSVNTPPSSGPALARIALQAALPGVGPDRFVEAVKETMGQVRAIYLDFIEVRSNQKA